MYRSCKCVIVKVLYAGSAIWFSMIAAIFWFFNAFLKKKAQVSRVNDDILLTSGTELSQKIRIRELSCVEVVESFIARIECVNPTLNSVVEDNFEEARRQARAVDESINNGTAPPEAEAPFLGVPFTNKDCIYVKGMLCTAGIPNRRHQRMEEDADGVRNMRRAGGIHLCLTNVSEVCMWWEASNTIYGTSRNPYDSRRITGGSSGGEGALIAAAGSVLGIGTDIGGSVRMPAFFSGIFGHKPTKYIVSDQGCYPTCVGYQTAMHCMGPMCRYAEDLSPMLRVLAGTSAGQLDLEKPVQISKVKVFYMEGMRSPFITPLSSDMRSALKKVVKYLETRFDTVCLRVDPPLMKLALPIWLNDMDVPEAPLFTEQMTGLTGDINPYLELGKWFLGKSVHTFPALCLALTERVVKNSEEEQKKLTSMREHLLKEFQEMLGTDGVLLFPSHPTSAPFHNQPIFQAFNYIYTGIFNSLGLPATQCPLGQNRDGVPVGVQVVGALYQDRLTIAMANELQRAFGGWVNPGGGFNS